MRIQKERSTCKCVRPIFMIWSNDLALVSNASRSSVSAGINERLISITAATCITVGKLPKNDFIGNLQCEAMTYVSLLLWLMLTWSLGWTGCFEPSWPPRISIARFEMTWERKGQLSIVVLRFGGNRQHLIGIHIALSAASCLIHD